MRFSALELLTLSSALLTSAAPFRIQDGELQRHRRRAVDYPVNFLSTPKGPRKLRKREAAPYSVVQVDGASPTGAAPPPPPPALTVTHPAPTPPPSTQTIVVTSVIPGPTSDETILITTTQVVQAVTTATLPAQIVTSNVVPPPVTYTFTPDLSATEVQVTNTVLDTVTSTLVSASSTAYYDDGLWHTYYPVKDFVPPYSTAEPQVPEPVAAAAPSSQYGLKNTSADTAPKPAGSDGANAHGRRWETGSAAPVAADATPSPPTANAAPAPTALTPVDAGSEQTMGAQALWQEGELRVKRKAPQGLKTANWIDGTGP